MPSFDVVATVDLQEVGNAVDQTRREIGTRYDLKGTKCAVELKDEVIEIQADDDMKLKAVAELLKQKLSKRGIDLKSVTFGEARKAGGDILVQEGALKQGLTAEELKKMTKAIKGEKIKVTPAMQGDHLRVSGKKRDDLQQVISFLKGEFSELPLQYINFRD